jgi:nitrogen fixation protein NifX
MIPPQPHLKAAFSTNSLAWVDADFVRARHLVFYDVTPTQADFLDAPEFRPVASGIGESRPAAGGCPAGAEPAHLDGSVAARLACLDGCGVLFTTALSDHTALRMTREGTFPVVIERRRAIEDVIARLQVLMTRDPPLWMCRLLRYGRPPLGRTALMSSAHDAF